MLNFFKKKIKCKHEFNLRNLHKTDIEPLDEPKTKGYSEWKEYYNEIYNHKSTTHRINCKCNKCGEVLYAHCGVSLDGKFVC